MKLVTWNVNSVRARETRLLACLERHAPDIVCLQETKVVREDFPAERLRAAGYELCVVGQKTYNGVAILSRQPTSRVITAFGDGGDDSQARLVAATIGGLHVVCVYVPNGRDVGSDKYDSKLEWLDRLRGFLRREYAPEEPVVVAGDFNVSPDDRDVHDPQAWEGQLLCSPPERSALREVVAWGLVDAFRHLHPDEIQFTWWDYRQLAFPRNHGLRIDHIYVTQPLVERLVEATIDRDERKGKGASDHVPVMAVLADR